MNLAAAQYCNCNNYPSFDTSIDADGFIYTSTSGIINNTTQQ